MAVVRRQDVASVLDRFARGDLSASEVTGWAELLEMRDDVGFEPGFEVPLREAIHWLANPVLNLPGEALDAAAVISFRKKINV